MADHVKQQMLDRGTAILKTDMEAGGVTVFDRAHYQIDEKYVPYARIWSASESIDTIGGNGRKLQKRQIDFTIQIVTKPSDDGFRGVIGIELEIEKLIAANRTFSVDGEPLLEGIEKTGSHTIYVGDGAKTHVVTTIDYVAGINTYDTDPTISTAQIGYRTRNHQ